MIERFAETLKSAHRSMTQPRRRVFEELAKRGPLTTTALVDYCGPDLDRATVYRTVELFEKLGVVNRIWHGFKSHIELSEIFTPHHHHAVCQNCGQSKDIVSPELESLLSHLAKEYNFLAVGHVVELSGYCRRCQNN